MTPNSLNLIYSNSLLNSCFYSTMFQSARVWRCNRLDCVLSRLESPRDLLLHRLTSRDDKNGMLRYLVVRIEIRSRSTTQYPSSDHFIEIWPLFTHGVGRPGQESGIYSCIHSSSLASIIVCIVRMVCTLHFHLCS
jgi:hypothetical protein